MSAAVDAQTCLAFDTAAKLTLAQAQLMSHSCFSCAIRYVSLTDPKPGDIDPVELQNLLAAGLAVMLVQHVRFPNWAPGGGIGKLDGQRAAANAAAAGYEKAAHLWCDLEGVKAGASSHAVIDHVNAWCEEVRAGGYKPGLYVGYAAGINAADLYSKLTVDRYWSDAGPREIATRGFCVKQLSPSTTLREINLTVDVNVIDVDALGGRPVWMQPTRT